MIPAGNTFTQQPILNYAPLDSQFTQVEKDTYLYEAIKQGNAQECRRWLLEGADVNGKSLCSEENPSPFILAVNLYGDYVKNSILMGFSPIFQVLIEDDSIDVMEAAEYLLGKRPFWIHKIAPLLIPKVLKEMGKSTEEFPINHLDEEEQLFYLLIRNKLVSECTDNNNNYQSIDINQALLNSLYKLITLRDKKVFKTILSQMVNDPEVDAGEIINCLLKKVEELDDKNEEQKVEELINAGNSPIKDENGESVYLWTVKALAGSIHELSYFLYGDKQITPKGLGKILSILKDKPHLERLKNSYVCSCLSELETYVNKFVKSEEDGRLSLITKIEWHQKEYRGGHVCPVILERKNGQITVLVTDSTGFNDSSTYTTRLYVNLRAFLPENTPIYFYRYPRQCRYDRSNCGIFSLRDLVKASQISNLHDFISSKKVEFDKSDYTGRVHELSDEFMKVAQHSHLYKPVGSELMDKGHLKERIVCANNDTNTWKVRTVNLYAQHFFRKYLGILFTNKISRLQEKQKQMIKAVLVDSELSSDSASTSDDDYDIFGEIEEDFDF